MNNFFPNSNVIEFEGAAGALHGGESKLMAARPGGSHPVPPEVAKRDLPVDQPPTNAQLQEARKSGHMTIDDCGAIMVARAVARVRRTSWRACLSDTQVLLAEYARTIAVPPLKFVNVRFPADVQKSGVAQTWRKTEGAPAHSLDVACGTHVEEQCSRVMYAREEARVLRC